VADEIRVRFAPSPTGFLHVGGARTALYNWLYARKVGGVFVLRIEDTDLERSNAESVDAIFEGMRWLGLDWDEGPGVGGDYGPYLQSERRELYQREVDRLLADEKAYPCFCTPDDLSSMREFLKAEGKDASYDGRCGKIPPEEAAARVAAGELHAVRFRSPSEGETVLFDVVRGKMVFQNQLFEDFVILKSDGLPSYNFAVVVDDVAMKISHVIRGDDHISNTPRHLMLYAALGYKLPKFAHLPMILGADKTRLSKRHGATAVAEFAKEGILPQGMMNYLALLGWSLDGKTEFFTAKKLVNAFSLKRVGSNPSVFDIEKLTWLSGEHFKNLPLDEKVTGIHAHLVDKGYDLGPVDERFTAMVELQGNRIKSFTEAEFGMDHFFRDLPNYDSKAVAEQLTGEGRARLAGLSERWQSLENFTASELEEALRAEAEVSSLKAGEIIHPMRVAVVGSTKSPDIFKTCELLGKQLTLKRLSARG
jgi:nondiscriminating glutamyl-tRNA synthetase